jgi:hypothetical protein
MQAQQMLRSEAAMVFTVTIIGFCLISLGIFAAGLLSSVEGYEDEQGFHIHWHNDRPDVADISCIWT